MLLYMAKRRSDLWDTMTPMLMPKPPKPRSKAVHRMVAPKTRRNLQPRPKQLRRQVNLNKSDIINTIIRPSRPSNNSSSLLEHLSALPPNSILVCSLPRCPTHTIPTISSMVSCHQTIKTRRIHTHFKLPPRTILFKVHNSTKLPTPGPVNLNIQCKVRPATASPQVRIPCLFHIAINSNMRHSMVLEVPGLLPIMQASGKFPNRALVQAKSPMDK